LRVVERDRLDLPMSETNVPTGVERGEGGGGVGGGGGKVGRRGLLRRSRSGGRRADALLGTRAPSGERKSAADPRIYLPGGTGSNGRIIGTSNKITPERKPCSTGLRQFPT